MVLLSELPESRLQHWIQGSYYHKISGSWRLLETHEDGKAEVDIHVVDEAWAFRLEGQRKFPFLKNGKCADVVIVERKEHRWILHLIECKRTIIEKKWRETKEQFEGALLRMLAILGVLGIHEVHEVKCYTAFRNDFSPHLTKNPAMLKSVAGVSPMLDWEGNRIQILSLKNCTHIKIPLDEQGRGKVVL